MAQKNDTPVLLLAFVITATLVGLGIWWFSRTTALNLSPVGQSPNTPGSLTAPSPSTSASTSPGPSASPIPSQTGQPTLAAFSDVKSVPSGLFNYGGSTVWAPLRLVVDTALQTAYPDFRLRYVGPGSKPPSSAEGIRMLLNDELAFAQSSRPLQTEEYNQAQQRGFRLQQIPVAIDGLAIAVNPNLKITGLTLSQLKDIYTDKIHNWQEVGGPDLPITPYSHPSTGGTPFEEKVLGGESFGANVQPISTTTLAIQQLAKDPGGIFYASAPELVPQCSVKTIALGTTADNLVPPYQEPFVPLSQCSTQRNRLNIQAFKQGTYPLTRNLFVIVKQNGRIDEQAGEAYVNLLLTKQGQELIEKAGFVRMFY